MTYVVAVTLVAIMLSILGSADAFYCHCDSEYSHKQLASYGIVANIMTNIFASILGCTLSARTTSLLFCLRPWITSLLL